MKNDLFWIVFVLLCIFVLPHIIDHVIMRYSIDDISEMPLVNGEYNE